MSIENNNQYKRILIYGPKDPVGGVERIVLNYVENIVTNHSDITFDYLEYGECFSQEEYLNQLGCRVIYLPSRKRNYLKYKRAIKEVFKDTSYIAVWGNYSGLTNIDLMIMGKRFGVPMRIAHSHGSKLYWDSLFMRIIVVILHHLNKLRLDSFVTHYWTCSFQSGKFMFPHKAWKKLELIPNGVNVSKYSYDSRIREETRKELGIPTDSVVVGHVARLCEVKNQFFLLKVIREMKRKAPKTKCLLVGEGELRSDIEKAIIELELSNNVIMLGNRKDVPRLLNAMDVFVLTSLSEGLSLSLVEAQSVGLPCVLPTTVSKENDLTGRVSFVSLDADVEIWATTIFQCATLGFADTRGELAKKGFDIESSSEKLYKRFVSGGAD